MGSKQSRGIAERKIDRQNYLAILNKDEINCSSAVKTVVQSGLDISSSDKDRLEESVLKPLKKLYSVLRACFGNTIGSFVNYKISSAQDISHGFQELISDILDLQKSVEGIGQKIENSPGKSAFGIFVGLVLAFFKAVVKHLTIFIDKFQKMLCEGERHLKILFGNYKSETGQFQSNLNSACIV